MNTPLRAMWLAWGAVVALLAYPAASQTIGQQSGIMGGDGGFFRPVGGATSTLTIDAMPYARTVTCGSYTLTGSASGAGAVSWSASPSGASGSCTGTTSWSCVVSVAPDATGEGVETITVSQSGGGSDTETIGFYVAGAHSCAMAQNVDGSYNSTLTNLDPAAPWQNTGSSALDFIQPTGTAQPTFRTSIVGGQPVVRYDSGDFSYAGLVADWPFLNNGSDFTVEAVWVAGVPDPNVLAVLFGTRTSIGTGVGFAMGMDDRTSSSRDDAVYNVMGNGSAVNFAYIGANNSIAQQQWHHHSVVLDDDGGAGADAFHYVDGSLLSSSTITASYSASNPGQQFRIGMATAVAPDVWRVSVYAKALTTTEQEINRAVDEWALDGTFPIAYSPPDPENTWLFIGDSLTAGSGGVATWVEKLHDEVPTVDFINAAKGGASTSAMLTAWRANDDPAPARVFVLGGINDIVADATAASAFANLNTIYTEAQAAGVEVVAIATLPFGTSTYWTAGRQTQLEALNASVLASLDADFTVNLYTAMQDPADLDAILPAYRLSDGLHPNEAGTAAMAAAVATALGL